MGRKSQFSKEYFANIAMGMLMQIYFLFPWIQTENGGYNAITFMIRAIRQRDFAETFHELYPKVRIFVENASGVVVQFKILLGLMLVIQILAFVMLVFAWRRVAVPAWPVTLSLVIATAILIIWQSAVRIGFSLQTETGMVIIPKSTCVYPLFALFVIGFWRIFIIIIENWDETAKQERERREAKKAYHEERKRRLMFPGKYSKLYYHVLWENLMYNWKDYFFLIVSGVISTFFLFVGWGIRELFNGKYGGDDGFIGPGLMRIMVNFLVVVVILDFVLILLVLTYYRKNHLTRNGLFEILGMRSNALRAVWLGEIIVAYVSATIIGLVGGRLFIKLFEWGIEYSFPEFGQLGELSRVPYVATIGVTFVISLFAFAVSRDISEVQNSSDVRLAAVRGEKMPGRFRWVGIITGILFMGCALKRFAQRHMAENILVFVFFLFGAYLLFKNAWGTYLKQKRKDVQKYFKTLISEHVIRYKFQTTVGYIMILTIIHTCSLFFFTMKMVSNQIAENPENTIPYDYVCMAYESDGETFERLEKECNAEITTFPMVRVATPDNTEEPNKFEDIVYPQGQNIGISESTYRELKHIRGEKPKKKLNLDVEGENVYIVYQQDKGAKARPIDYYFGSKHPYMHIGQPVPAYTYYKRHEIYTKRNIIGEEVGSLIGSYRQGAYENIVVFSDEYFKKVRECWKTTNWMTGEPLKPNEIVIGETVHEGVTKLQLINVPEKYLKKTEQILEQYKENHAYDDSVDSFVKSVYERSEAIRQRKMERLMEITVNGFVIVVLLIISLFLLQMKVRMEVQEMKKRYRFMECFGMKREEQIREEKREIARFLWVPLALTVPITLVFTAITFYLRQFTLENIICYVGWTTVIWILYVGIQIINMKYLQNSVVKEVENFER